MSKDLDIPVPTRKPLVAQLLGQASAPVRPNSSCDTTSTAKRARPSFRPTTPDFGAKSAAANSSYTAIDNTLQQQRLHFYALDYPRDYAEYLEHCTDPNSKWFSRKADRKLDLNSLLPYNTETHTDQAKYLCHIVVHLYIAIRSLDIEGLINISTKDLAVLKNEVELTLDTDFYSFDVSYEEPNDSDDFLASRVFGKVLPKSATIISVNHWTNELKTCLKMKFNLPLTLRASLANVYYNLTLSEGQSINTALFVEMFTLLVDKYTNLLNEKQLLHLNHTTLLNYFKKFYPDPDPNFDSYSSFSNKSNKKLFALVGKLAKHSSRFFDQTAVMDFFNFSMSRVSLATMQQSLNILSVTSPIIINDHFSTLDLLSSVFHLWSNSSTIKLVDIHSLSVLHPMIEESYHMTNDGLLEGKYLTHNEFGILTDLQIDFIFNRLQNNLRNHYKISSQITEFSEILVYSFNGEHFDSFFHKLKILLNSIQTYAHPSNLGAWSPLIARFTHKFIKCLHKRVKLEKDPDSKIPESFKISPEQRNQLIDAFKNLVYLGSQSKSEANGNYYVSSIGYLSDLDCDKSSTLVDHVLVELYDCFSGQFIDSSHRIIVVLKQFTEVSRFMVNNELYRVHITYILSLLIEKIDTNDLNLTSNLLNSFVTVASCIPFQQIEKSSDNDFYSFESSTIQFISDHIESIKSQVDFKPDESIIKTAFVCSTEIFNDNLKKFVNKIFNLFEADLNDKLSFKITQTILILTQSLTKDTFDIFAKQIENNLFNEDLKEYNTDLLANLFGALVKYKPELSCKYFKKLNKIIREEISQGAGLVRDISNNISPRDKKLSLHLRILDMILTVSNDQILNFKQDFTNLISFLYEEIKNPSLYYWISNLIYSSLQGLTNIRLKENKLFKPNTTVKIEDQWGGFQFNDRRFDSENLEFEWYQPTIEGVSFAVDIFETFVTKSLSSLNEVINSNDWNNNDLVIADKFDKDLKFLTSSLSGISILVDPDFNSKSEDDDEGNKFNSIPLHKKLMILKSLRNAKSDPNEINIDIEQINNSSTKITVDENQQNDSKLNSLNSNINVDDNTSNDFMNTSTTLLPSNTDDIPGSRLLTPSLPLSSGSEIDSVMNPSISAREEKIFNCGYFYGSNSAEKNSFITYQHLHKLRSLVAEGLHESFEFLTKENNSGNFKLIQSMLSSMHSYFCDAGLSSIFVEGYDLTIDYKFMKKAQSIGNYKKPFSRTCLGARIESFHKQRIILHSTNRFLTSLDRTLLKDVVSLCASPYQNISRNARGTLVASMKKLIGSYDLVFELLTQELQLALESQDWNKLKSCLDCLLLKKIHSKVMNDYKNLPTFIELLSKCINVDDLTVNTMTQKLLSTLPNVINIPSEVIYFDVDEIDKALRPPDSKIDLEIETLKTAKTNKRVLYLEKINEFQDLVINLEESTNHWKTSLLYIRILAELQHFYEIKINPKFFQLLIENSKSNHPELVTKCISILTKMFKKLMIFARFGYDINNVYNPNYIRNDIEIIDTSKLRENEFIAELNNFQNPSFFIDGYVYNGWLFWDKEIQVLKNESLLKSLKLDENDSFVLKQLGGMISKEWLTLIIQVLMQDNESKSVFKGPNVQLISNIIYLISIGVTSIKYQDLTDLISEIYLKDQKETVILAVEIIGGLLIATDHTTEKDLATRDEFLDKFFDNAFSSDLTQDSASSWSVLLWWILTRVDPRRIPILKEKALKLDGIIDKSSDLAFVQSSRVSFASTYISASSWCFNEQEKVVDSLVLDHPYNSVRRQIGSLLESVCVTSLKENLANCEEFLRLQQKNDLGTRFIELSSGLSMKIKEIFQKIEELRIKSGELPVQELLKTDYFYMSYTMLTWLYDMMKGIFSLSLSPFFKEEITPFLMNLNNNRELCKLSSIEPGFLFEEFAKLELRPEWFKDVLEVVHYEYDSTHQLQVQLSFIEKFFDHQFLLLSSSDKERLISRIDKLLFHGNIEIRTRAAEILSGFIHHSADLKEIESYIDRYVSRLSKRKSGSGGTKISKEELIVLHGCVLGVGAFVSAFPYVSPPPPWLLEKVSILAKSCSISGIVGKSAKSVLSNFKKVRSDTWQFDKLSFSTELSEDLEGVLWSSYYA